MNACKLAAIIDAHEDRVAELVGVADLGREETKDRFVVGDRRRIRMCMQLEPARKALFPKHGEAVECLWLPDPVGRSRGVDQDGSPAPVSDRRYWRSDGRPSRCGVDHGSIDIARTEVEAPRVVGSRVTDVARGAGSRDALAGEGDRAVTVPVLRCRFPPKRSQ